MKNGSKASPEKKVTKAPVPTGTDRLAKGARAEMLKKELGDVFLDLEQRIEHTFRHCDMHDLEGMRACRYYLEVLNDVRGRLEYRIETGKAAQKELVTLN